MMFIKKVSKMKNSQRIFTRVIYFIEMGPLVVEMRLVIVAMLPPVVVEMPLVTYKLQFFRKYNH